MIKNDAKFNMEVLRLLSNIESVIDMKMFHDQVPSGMLERLDGAIEKLTERIIETDDFAYDKSKVEKAIDILSSVGEDIIATVFFSIDKESSLMFFLDGLEDREKMVEIEEVIETLTESNNINDKNILVDIIRLRDLGIGDILIGS